MLETENPTFADILEYISEKKASYFGRLVGTDLRISDKEEQKMEDNIMTTIDKLRAKNKAFDIAYLNLVLGDRKAVQRVVSKRDLATLIYLNLLPETSKVMLAQIINPRRMEIKLPPIITKNTDNKGAEYKVFFGDESIESVEDAFNKQFLGTVEFYYHKIVGQMSERNDDDLSWGSPIKLGCEVDKMYRELGATALLAENLGFNVEKILEKSEIGDLYSFIKRGTLVRNRHK